MFKHELGCEVEAKVTRLRGVVTSRSECLYGCNRYYIQPPADKDMKIPEGWWVDEDDIVVVGQGVNVARGENPPGGPMSKIR